MGTRYAVATGDWQDPYVWSETSGGTPGAIPPTPDDDVIFDAASGAITVTATDPGTSGYYAIYDNYLYCRNLTCTGFTGTLAGTSAILIYGNLTLVSGMTYTHTGTFKFRNDSYGTTQTITTGGKTIGAISIALTDGTIELGDNLTCGNITLAWGKLDTTSNNYSISCTNLTASYLQNQQPIELNLRSSAVTISGNLTVSSGFNTVANIGSASFTFTGASSTITATNRTFDSVTFNNAGAAGTCAIASAGNTFTNLTINGPSSGIRLFSLAANITVTGTLTVSGNGGGSQLRVISNTLRTQRTITAAAYAGSATDVTWRDIVVAGAAAPISGTRFGDMGNNSGITMSAPKTVYWNLAGSQAWTATAWATTSGGSPGIDNYPLPQDTGVFDDAGSITTLTLSGDVMGTADMSARTSAMTITTTGATSIYGGWEFGSGCTTTAGANTLTISPISSNFINCNSITFNFPVTIDTLSTVTLSSAFLMAADRALIHNRGTFDANNYNVTCGSFTSTGTTVRAIKAGSGVWSISGVGPTLAGSYATLWNLNDPTNLTWDPGTAEILFSTTSNGNRAFYSGNLYYHKFTIGGSTGTGNVFMDGGAAFFGEITSIKTVAHGIVTDGDHWIGYFNISGSAGNLFNFTRSGSFAYWVVLDQNPSIDYLSFGIWEFEDPGIIVYTGPNSSAVTGAINTAPPAPRTLYWVGGSGNINDTNKWSLFSGGAGGQPVPRQMDTVIFDNNSNATAYTVTINTAFRCKNLTIGAPGSGNVTIVHSSSASKLWLYGDVNLSGGANITWSYAFEIFLFGSNGNYTFNSAGVTINSIAFYGHSTYTLTSALTSNGSLTFAGRELNFDTYNVSVTQLLSNSRWTRKLSLGSGTTTLSNATATNFGTAVVSDNTLTIDPGTSTIVINAAAATTFNGAGRTYRDLQRTGAGALTINGNNTFNNVSFTNTTAATHVIAGSNTFNDLTFTAAASGVMAVAFGGNQTINGTLTASGASFLRRFWMYSNTLGTARTLSVATYAGSAQDVDFRDIAVIGAAAPLTGTRFGDWFGNSGITMSAPKTVYWNLAGTQDWTATGWATSSGGVPDANNFPLAQDTAIFDNTGSAGTVTVTSTYALPSIDASARTNAMTLSAGGNMVTYGGVTLGSGVTTSWSSFDLSFYGRGLYNLNSAGKTMPNITMYGIGGTLTLQSAITAGTASSTGYMQLLAGKLDLNNYAVTTGGFYSNSFIARILDFGSSGVLNLARTSSVDDSDSLFQMHVEGVGSTFSVEGTSVINLTANTASLRIIHPRNEYLNFNVTAGSGTISVIRDFPGGAWLGDLNFTGSTGPFLIRDNTYIYGDLTFVSGQTVTAPPSTATELYFSGNTTLTSAGTLLRRFTINGILRLADNASMVSGGTTIHMQFLGGVLDLNGYTVTVPNRYDAGYVIDSVHIIKSNGGSVIITASGTTILVGGNYNVYAAIKNDPATINCTYAGGVGTRTLNVSFLGYNFLEYYRYNTIKVSAGTDIISFPTNSYTPGVDFTGFSGSLAATNPVYITGSVTYSGSMTVTATSAYRVQSSDGRPYIFNLNSVTLNASILSAMASPGGIKFGSATTWAVNYTNNLGGALYTDNYTVNLSQITTNSQCYRIIDTGSLGLNLTANNATVFSSNNPILLYTIGAGINLTYSGGTGTRTFDVGSTGSVTSATLANKWVVKLNVTAGTDIVAISTSRVYGDIDFTGFSGTHTVQANNRWYGDAIFSSTMTLTASASAQAFNGNVIQNITTNGKTLDWPIIVENASGTFKLLDNMTIGSGRTITFTAGGIDLNNYTLSVGIFSSSNSNVRQITFGSGTLTLVAAGTAWNAATSTNFTINSGTGTISMTSGSAKTFAGGGLSYPKLNQGGAGSLSITGTNTFADISNTNPTACTIIFPNVTTTVANFTASGTSGNLLTLSRTGASGTFTLSKTSGVVGVDFISVSNSIATGGATWYAGANSTDAGNNTGWIFTAPPAAASSNMFFMF